jgi:hypothetical protein
VRRTTSIHSTPARAQRDLDVAHGRLRLLAEIAAPDGPELPIERDLAGEVDDLRAGRSRRG